MAPSLSLQQDWDEPLQAPHPSQEKRGRFVGRRRERDLLALELRASSQRSILLAGYRGVGKTSLVYQALHDVSSTQARDSSQKYLLVVLNAAQLKETKDTIAPREVLRNLIRRLFTAINEHPDVDRDVRRSVSELYQKAAAANFEEQAERIREDITKLARSWLLRGSGRLSGVTVGLWAASTSAAVAVGLIGSSAATTLTAVFLAGPVPVMSHFAVTYVRKKELSSSTTNQARLVYAFDNSVSNLEYDLERVHQLLHAENFTTIYVIDELDKLEVADVIEVLQFFKHLFTLASAIFVFVAGDDLAQHFRQPSDVSSEAFRPKEYTYFKSRYVIARPSPEDLRLYLDEIIRDSESAEDTRALRRDFEDLVVFESRGDYFDLLQVVRDRISGVDGSFPVVDLESVTEAERRRIVLKRVVDVLDEKYRVSRPSRWVENEDVLRRLYDYAHVIADAYPGLEVHDDAGDVAASSAQRDLNTVLVRMGVLKVDSQTEEDVRGVTIARRTLSVSTRSMLRAPAALGFLAEWEQELASSIEGLFELVRAAANLDRYARGESLLSHEEVRSAPLPAMRELARTGPNIVTASAEMRQIYSRLKRTAPPAILDREEAEARLEETNALLAHVAAELPAALGARLASALGAQSRPAGSDTRAFSSRGLQEYFRSAADSASVVVRSRGKRRELLITPPLVPDVVSRYKEVIRSHEKMHRTLVIGQSARRYRVKPKGLRTLSNSPRDTGQNDDTLSWVVDWLRE
jgi:Cdc6-like AAA superfamily ATPase